MFVRALAVLVALSIWPWACLAQDITATERHWLGHLSPVVQAARAEGLPVDVLVQPQATPGQAPLALAYVDDRCQLIVSLRGNALADRALVDVPLELQPGVLELMAAHEVAHCRRHVSGTWNRLPAHLREDETPTPAVIAQWRAQRREEGLADLAGLAWIARHRPAQYGALHGWLLRTREHEALPYTPHDTRAWLRLAEDPGWIHGPLPDSPDGLWSRGLLEPD